MQIRKKGGWNLKKILSSETTEPISTKFAEMILGWSPSKIVSVDPPFFYILSLAAILVRSRDKRTQFWKGAIQESFQQNLVDIGSVVS